MKSWLKWWKKGYTVALITLISLALHAWAVFLLPVDYDEPVYLQAGQDYAELIRSGDFRGVVDYSENQEHPPLIKLIYSIPYLFFEQGYASSAAFYFARIVSALFGTGVVLIVSLIDPLAGFFLAFSSLTIKYTSQAYLEALPFFTMTLAILLLERTPKAQRNRNFWISAILVGISGAGKYTYAMAGILLIYLLIRGKFHWKDWFYFGFTALAVFWLCNPHLWIHPIQRLGDSLLFHANYSQSDWVKNSGYPWYQPILWICQAVPWHPEVFFFLTTDALIFWLGIPGLWFAWKNKKYWLIIWFISCLLILFAWSTHWPQYTLILIPPLCFMAADLTRIVIKWALAQNSYWDYLGAMLPRPPRIFWVALVLFTGAISLGYIIYQVNLTIARQGWYQVTVDSSPLPSNEVNDIASLPDGRVILATGRGVAVWTPNQESLWGDSVLTFTTQNSSLPVDDTDCVTVDSKSRWWFCTSMGVALFENGIWSGFTSSEMGMPDAKIITIEEDDAGNIWIASSHGIGLWNGTEWKTYTTRDSGILDDYVYDIAVQKDFIWFGSQRGASRYSPSTGEWKVFDFSDVVLGWDGLQDLMVDTQGELWAATIGNGLGHWTGTEWEFLRVDNSEIPRNTLQRIVQFPEEPGVMWLGFSYGMDPGGLVVRYDGTTWKTYTPRNSGYSGTEPLAISRDKTGRYWFGTTTGGVVVYEPH